PSLQESVARGLGFEYQKLLDSPGKRLDAPCNIRDVACHSNSDVIESIDQLVLELYIRLEQAGVRAGGLESIQSETLGSSSSEITRTLRFACEEIVPKLEHASDEIHYLLNALEGRYVPPGPAGAPTRGMAHILPTGRNFYAVDPRALP